MTFAGWTRLLAVAIAGVLCFGILVPLAWRRHDTVLAVAVAVLYLAYAVANVAIWRRLRSQR